MFILILFAHVGMMGSGNSNSVTTAEFSTQTRCESAGSSAASMSDGSTKLIKFRCVPK